MLGFYVGCIRQVYILRTTTFCRAGQKVSPPPVGLEPTTTGLKGQRSTDWAKEDTFRVERMMHWQWWCRGGDCETPQPSGLSTRKTTSVVWWRDFDEKGFVKSDSTDTQAIPGFELGFQESESCVLTNYTISPIQLLTESQFFVNKAISVAYPPKIN